MIITKDEPYTQKEIEQLKEQFYEELTKYFFKELS
jgi:hypothetical protein